MRVIRHHQVTQEFLSERNRHNRLKLMETWPELHEALDKLAESSGGVYVAGMGTGRFDDPELDVVPS